MRKLIGWVGLAAATLLTACGGGGGSPGDTPESYTITLRAATPMLASLGGLVFSQRILLALTQKGMSREASYAAVQRNAMDAWRGNASLLALCRADKEIGEFLADDELTALFDMSYHTKHVDTIFKRVFG